MRANKLNIMRYLSVTSALLLLVMSVTGCNEEAAPTDSINKNQSEVLLKGPVIHNGADQIKGKGKRGSVDFVFHVVITPSGQVNGKFFAENPGVFTIKGKVDCGSVIGNVGVFGGPVDGAEDHFTVKVTDGPDGFIFGVNRPNCDTGGFGVPIPITEGEITVVDR